MCNKMDRIKYEKVVDKTREAKKICVVEYKGKMAEGDDKNL